MNRDRSLAAFAVELCRLMSVTADRDPALLSDTEFNRLALQLFSLQFEYNPVLRTFSEAQRRTPQMLSHWTEIPAIPTRAFKEFEVTSLTPAERSQTFQSSGTTAERTSRHFHCPESLEVYEASLTPWFAKHLLPAPEIRPRLLSLIPDNAIAPHSSLAHMMATVRRLFASTESVCAGRVETDGSWSIDFAGVIEALHQSHKVHASDPRRMVVQTTHEPGHPLTPSLSPTGGEGAQPVHCSLGEGGRAGEGESPFMVTMQTNSGVDRFSETFHPSPTTPLLIVGTAFGFVHLLEELERLQLTFVLPAGSCVMETGGYKGRARALPQVELHAWITARLGVPSARIVCEYGMSELSSQAYDLVVGHGSKGARRCFHFPPWARARVLSAETSREVKPGETGLLQVVDLANVWSACAILTEDLAVRRDGGFELLGRAAQAEPKGCSLM